MRIRWRNVLIASAAAAAVTAYAMPREEPQTLERFHTVEAGETVWSICAAEATDEVDVRDMVRWTMQRNHIFDAANVPQGMTIIVPVVKTK